MTIRNRLTFQFFLLVLGIIVVASVVIYVFSERHRKQDFFNRLKSKAESTSKLLISVDEVDFEVLQRIEYDNPLSLPEEGIVIWNDKNQIIFNSDKKKHIENNPRFLQQIREGQELYYEKGDFEVIGFLYSDSYGRFVVMAVAKDIDGKRRINDLKWVLVAVFGFSLGFILLAGWLYAGRALLPISKIIDRVKQISISNIQVRLDEGKNEDEIAALAHTFNLMLDRLESGIKIQKDFIANASHEMRTPLTAMTGQLEVTLMRERQAEKYKEVLLSVLDDIKNLNRTSNRLLLLAQANTENLQIEMEELRIDDLIWQCQEELMKLQPKYEVRVDLDFDEDSAEDLQVFGNVQLLKTALTNIMENGCKYSPDKKVNVTILSKSIGTTIEFKDKGIGIPAEDLPHIFQPFYRASNSSASRGHGIGLSIVDKIIKIHQGTLQVESQLGSGSTFRIFLPRKT